MPPNAKSVIEAFYTAFEDNPFEASVAKFLVPDVVWHVAGSNPLAGTFIGIDEVLGAMRAYGQVSNHTLSLDTMTLLADEHHVVAIHDASATVSGFAYRAHEVDVFHLRRQQIEAFWSFSEDQEATDRLWSS